MLVEISGIWLLLSAVLLTVSVVALWWLTMRVLKQVQENNQLMLDRLTSSSQFQVSQMTMDHRSSLTALSQSLGSVAQESTAQQRLWSQQVDKVTGLLGTKDPISFQQVQAMTPTSGYDDTTYDPSEAGEIKRLHERETNPAEALNGDEEQLLGEVIGDPFFN